MIASLGILSVSLTRFVHIRASAAANLCQPVLDVIGNNDPTLLAAAAIFAPPVALYITSVDNPGNDMVIRLIEALRH